MKNSSNYFFKSVVLSYLLIFNNYVAKAQNQDINHKDLSSLKTANIVGFIPASNSKINGLGIKYSQIITESENNPDVNGMRLNIDPLTIFVPFLLVMHSSEIKSEPYLDDDSLLNFNTINGLDIGLFNGGNSKINGLEIIVSGGFGTSTNGISVGLVQKHYKMNGIEIGALRTVSNKCRGIQIGLVNNCKNLKGLQIGLWNKNQKRNFPLINWNF